MGRLNLFYTEIMLDHLIEGIQGSLDELKEIKAEYYNSVSYNKRIQRSGMKKSVYLYHYSNDKFVMKFCTKRSPRFMVPINSLKDYSDLINKYNIKKVRIVQKKLED